MRMIGSTFGATLFGWLLNYHIRAGLSTSQKNSDIIKILVDPLQRINYTSEFISHLRNILAGAVHNVYFYLAVIVLLGIIAAALIPKDIKQEGL